MQKRTLQILLTLAVLWSGASTYLYVRLKNNPRVIAVTTNLNSPLTTETYQLGEMEKITFLRQYLERYFNYDANNFWQTQTSLSFLMSPELRTRHLEEVRRLREKIQHKNLVRKSQLLSLSSRGDTEFTANLRVQITEDGSASSTLYVSLLLGLEVTERTLENPWGLLVTKMDFAKSTTEEMPLTKTVKIKDKTPVILTLPCAIENIETPADSTLKTKITTLNVSEVQLTCSSPLRNPIELKALCKQTEFTFQVIPAESEVDLFKSFAMTAGSVRKKIDTHKPRQKELYEKTIEKVLGIKVGD